MWQNPQGTRTTSLVKHSEQKLLFSPHPHFESTVLLAFRLLASSPPRLLASSPPRLLAGSPESRRIPRVPGPWNAGEKPTVKQPSSASEHAWTAIVQRARLQ